MCGGKSGHSHEKKGGGGEKLLSTVAPCSVIARPTIISKERVHVCVCAGGWAAVNAIAVCDS